MSDFSAWCEEMRANNEHRTKQHDEHILAFKHQKQHDRHCYARLLAHIDAYLVLAEDDPRRPALVREYRGSRHAP